FAREYMQAALSEGGASAAIGAHNRSEALAALVRGKDRTSRSLLGFVALARVPLSAASLKELTGLHNRGVRPRLTRMAAEGVITWDSDGVRIGQEYYRSIIVEMMLDTHEQRYHRTLARWFAARGRKHAAEAGYHLEA